MQQDYFRPRGDITTVLDRADRDAQDNTLFPIDVEGSWFHRAARTIVPSTLSVQEFPQRGPADWGQRMTFELEGFTAGDLLHHVVLQIRLGSWYDGSVIARLSEGLITTDPTEDYWTFARSLGTVIIESAEFVVGDQTIERITGDWIRTWLTLATDRNALFGVQTDGVAGTLDPRRPFPTEDGTLFCVLPFFFSRTKLTETFPLLACRTVRIDVTLRPFEECCRRVVGAAGGQTPLGRAVRFLQVSDGSVVTVHTATHPPAFRDVRIVTGTYLIAGKVREAMMRQPFEQMVRLVQAFHFEEPLKYLAASSADSVDIQLPLELNHPVVELLWVLRRKGVRANNDWADYSTTGPWLSRASLRVNGSELMAAEGDWWRQAIAKVHYGGITAYQANVYGYSFSADPQSHQPSGSANMSRATSVTLRLTVLPVSTGAEVEGWEVMVWAVHMNWLRFENGMCQRMFSS